MELNKTLSFWDVFSIALGQVIGSGIMVRIGIGIEFTAYAIPFAFVLSACLSIIKQLPVIRRYAQSPPVAPGPARNSLSDTMGSTTT